MDAFRPRHASFEAGALEVTFDPEPAGASGIKV